MRKLLVLLVICSLLLAIGYVVTVDLHASEYLPVRSTEIESSQVVYQGQTEPLRNQIHIVNLTVDSNGHAANGTGYWILGQNGVEFISVKHAILSRYLMLESRQTRVFVDYEFECTQADVVGDQVEFRGDGVCRVFMDDDFNPAGIRMVRDVSHVPEEISIYSQEREVWMHFKVFRNLENGFLAEGVPVDIDGDGEADFTSNVCLGMSGSAAVESLGGVPQLDDDGMMISRGELVGAGILEADAGCSSLILVINAEFE